MLSRILLLAAALSAAGGALAGVVASVGGEKIDDVELGAKLAAEERSLNRALSAEEKAGLLQMLINQRLLVAKAKEEGLHQKDEFKRTAQDYERQLLSNAVYDELVSRKVSVSEAEAKEAFDKNQGLFELRKLGQVLVQVPSKDKEAAAKKKAERLMAQLAANPGSFPQVAKKESEDPVSKAKSGDLGELRRNMLLPELSKAVFEAKLGSVVGPIQTQYGFHIMQVRSSRKQGFEEAKEEILKEIRLKKSQDLERQLLDELAKKYKVKVSGAK